MNITKFCETVKIHFPQEDIVQWSLKKEWIEFSKIYFSSVRPTKRYVKGAYDFFLRNEKAITSMLKREFMFSNDSTTGKYYYGCLS